MSFEEYCREIEEGTPYAFSAEELKDFHDKGWEVEEVISWAEEELDGGLQGSDGEMLGDL